jgi:hypothetical protein
MSDFDSVQWLESQSRPVVERKPLAPVGVNNARIASAEKYKSQKGNWTVKVVFDMNNEVNREHTEYYNLWATNEDAKRISNEHFTALAKACGYKSFPSEASELVGKTLELGIYHKDETWQNQDGEEVTSTKTFIGEYLSAVKPVTPAKEQKEAGKVPPIL